MGNSCCGLKYRSSSVVWAAGDSVWTSDNDDSGLPLASKANKQLVVVEKQSLLGFQNKLKTASSKSSSTREVKINISWKQLQELLRRGGDVHNIPVDQVLSRLMNASDHNDIHFERPWRPVLQTIPELN